jgi:hypothetical protein
MKIMKLKLLWVIIAALALLATVATPALASVPTTSTQKVIGAGWFVSKDCAPYPLADPPPVPKQKISFDVNVEISGTSACGWFNLMNYNTKTFIRGTVTSSYVTGPTVCGVHGVALVGTCRVNGQSDVPFEVWLFDVGKGLRAIGRDWVDFYISPGDRPDMYFVGALWGGDIIICPPTPSNGS